MELIFEDSEMSFQVMVFEEQLVFEEQAQLRVDS
jgi:hypothetical protein